MSPKRLLQPAWWASHWPNALVYIFVCAVFVLGLWNLAQQGRAAREADLRFCRSSNERTVVIRDFILNASRDPDPRQYEFITDPALRQGVIEQSRKGRAAQREQAERTFVPRDCDAEYPQP